MMIDVVDMTDTSLDDERRALMLRSAAERGMTVGLVPHPDEDRSVLGICPRAEWSPEARATYEGVEQAVRHRCLCGGEPAARCAGGGCGCEGCCAAGGSSEPRRR